MKDYYALLGVKSTASPAQIDTAYRRLMQRHHPNARSSPQSLDRLRELNEAWRVLSDPAQRAAYDRARASGESFQPPAPPSAPRAFPQSAQSEFGARCSTGGTCLVTTGVVSLLLFAFAILGWGLNQQVDLFHVLNDWQREIGTVMPILPTAEIAVALSEQTPTPDPRCRDGCETPPPGCVVKGDVEADGTRFFYLPNDEGYAAVQVNTTRGDRWFCALNDAQSAGWTRKAPTATPTLPPPPEALTTQTARRAFVVCGDDAALRQGPGDDFPIAQSAEMGARLVVTGMNGEWSVVNTEGGSLYIRTNVLCAPTRMASAPTQAGNAPAARTATPSADSVAGAAASSFKYAAPLLVAPSNGSKYWCSRELMLQWSLTAPALAADEYFLIESKPHEREHWTALADWTKDTRVILYPAKGDGACDALWWGNTGVYEWRVSIVRGSKETPTYLSPFSETWMINYAQ